MEEERWRGEVEGVGWGGEGGWGKGREVKGVGGGECMLNCTRTTAKHTFIHE